MQSFQHDVSKYHQPCNYKCLEKKEVHKGKVPKFRKVFGNGKAERNKQEKVSGGDIYTFSVIFKEKCEPGHQNNNNGWNKNSNKIVIEMPFTLKAKDKACGFEEDFILLRQSCLGITYYPLFFPEGISDFAKTL